MNEIDDSKNSKSAHEGLEAKPAHGDSAARQRHELEELERQEREEMEEFERRQGRAFTIKIERIEYEVHERRLTGLQLRHLPTPPIGPDRDLFEVVPGGSDRKIADDVEVKMRDGLRFFTAPAQINPGAAQVSRNVAAA